MTEHRQNEGTGQTPSGGTEKARWEFACSGCGKQQYQTRKLIALSQPHTFICDECISLCSEILSDEAVADKVTISKADFDRYRKAERDLNWLKIWVESVRDSVSRANAELGKHD